MKYLDDPQRSNRDSTGQPIWPEVLVARSEIEANTLCEYLNRVSFEQVLCDWKEDDPDANEDFVYERWLETDPGQYIVEFVPDLSRYSEIYRIADSLMLASELFDTMNFHDTL